MHHTIKCLTSILSIILFLSSCKKDERTAEEWGQLAEAKLNEISQLGENIPCDKQSHVSLQEIPMGCDAQYFAVLSSDIDKFNRLKDEYQRYADAQADAGAKEGWVNDTSPCWMASWMSNQPLRLECKNNKVELITTDDISKAEAKSLAETTQKQLTDLLNLQTCTSASNWVFTALIKDKTMAIQFIPVTADGSSKEFNRRVALYNRLMMRIIDAEGTREPMATMPRVKGVDCVNGKPTIQLLD